MDNLTGTWHGEYSQNTGTEANPKVEYHSFSMEIPDRDGQIEGNSKDLTLSNEPARISGFYENNFISFIKKYERLISLDKSGQYMGDNTSMHPEIHYSGTFNEDNDRFEGTWEMQESEDRISLQDQFNIKYQEGNWYMSKVNEIQD